MTVPLLYPAFPDQGDPRAARGWQALLAFMSFPWRLLALAIATVAACSTTDLVQIWRDPAYKAAPVRLVLVIAAYARNAFVGSSPSPRRTMLTLSSFASAAPPHLRDWTICPAGMPICDDACSRRNCRARLSRPGAGRHALLGSGRE